MGTIPSSVLFLLDIQQKTQSKHDWCIHQLRQRLLSPSKTLLNKKEVFFLKILCMPSLEKYGTTLPPALFLKLNLNFNLCIFLKT